MRLKREQKVILSIIVVLLVPIIMCSVMLYKRLQQSGNVNTINIADVEWYDENTEEFVITTAQELEDLTVLSEFYDFKGQTIKLGADIVVNEGNAEDWEKQAPVNCWNSISGFAGTFDGQGYTISGLYGKTIDQALGVFSNTKASSVIQNFKLVNCYFEAEGSSRLASVVGGTAKGGTIKQVYSDAILNYRGDHCGGIVAYISADTVIEECWFDGTILTRGWVAGGIVGVATDSTATIRHCLSTGKITSTFTEAGARVGGLCGFVKIYGTVEIEDSLSACEIEVANESQNGSVIGCVNYNTTLKVTDVYAAKETYVTACTINSSGTQKGRALTYNTSKLIGNAAYQWTTLDFETYWAVVADDVPVLQCFAEEIPSLEGVEKKYSLDWYSASEKEYTLSSKEDVYGFMLLGLVRDNKYKGKTVKLDEDISLNSGKASAWAEEEPEYEWFAISEFAGVFDGQNHAISGIYLDCTHDYAGMFSQLTATSVVRNLSIKNSYLTSSGKGLGSIAGLSKAVIENVYSNALIYNSNTATNTEGTGGMVGRIQDGTLRNCWFDGTATTDYRGIGGMVGRVLPGTTTIEHCLNSGTIVKTDALKTAARMGGLVGLVQTTTEAANLVLKDSLNAGLLTSTISVSQSGQLVGRISSSKEDIVGKVTIRNSYSVSNCLIKDGKSTEKLLGSTTLNGKTDTSFLDAEMATLPKDELSGYSAYQNTMLDFTNYWMVVLEDTPVLKCFASKKVSLNGMFTYDISWYSAKEDVYVIKDYADLQGLSVLAALGNDFVGKTILLDADITMNDGNASDWVTTVPAYKWLPIVTFAGTFDGQGHSISGLYLNRDVNYQGLFGTISETGVVRNLTIENSYLTGSGTGMGSVAGLAKGLIENVYSNAIIYNTNTVTNTEGTGGIAGRTNGATIRNCWFAGSATSDYRGVGGIIGRVITGTTIIENCLNTGTISKTDVVKSAARMGGLVGLVQTTTKVCNLVVKDSVNTGLITSDYSVNQSGQLIGRVTCSTKDVIGTVNISNSYSVAGSLVKGNTTTEKLIGESQLAGVNDTSMITLGAVIYPREYLEGYGACRSTLLDFDTHWTVVLGDMPILQKFADNILSTDGQVTVDISWYDESRKTQKIADYGDLLGVSVLSALGNQFAGKTLLVTKDITINEGNASDWSEDTPEYLWIAIGSKNYPFKGTFDGQGHSVSGIYLNSTATRQGMFGYTKEAVIKNFELKNSYLSSTSTRLGSIVGDGSVKMTSVSSDAYVVGRHNGSGSYIGGLVGCISSVFDENLISDCWFKGSVETKAAQNIGGIIGGITESLQMEHCLVTGSVYSANAINAPRVGGFCGYVAAKKKLSLSDSVYSGDIIFEYDTTNYTLEDKKGSQNQSGVIVGNCSASAIQAENVYTDTRQAEIYGVLKNLGYANTSATSIEGITLKEDIQGFGGASANLDYTTEDGNAAYWVLVGGDVPQLKIFTTSGLLYMPDTTWYNAETKTGTIVDVADLYGMAKLSAEGETFEGAVVRLGANIEVNEGNADDWEKNAPTYGWSSIGTTDIRFKGSFDGQGYTISGLYLNSTENYQGLFGYVETSGEIGNFRLENSCLMSVGKVLGSIAGGGYATFRNIYSDARIINTCNKDLGRVAGVIGVATGGTTFIEQCWFDGTIVALAQEVGGMVGAVNNTVEITHCLNSGTILNSYSASAPRTGGICGIVNRNKRLTIVDTLNAGSLTLDNSTNQCGTVIGYVLGSASATNVYATTNTCLNNEQAVAIGYSDGLVGGEGITSVSGDITGDLAKTNAADLDWAEYWVVVPGDIPTLQVFRADITWYAEATGEVSDDVNDPYIIDSAKDLYGLALLSRTLDFKNKTIKLNTSIVLNADTPVTQNEWTAYLDSNTLHEWTAIGTEENPFKGTFDGGGNSIEGIYLDSSDDYQGLFGHISGAKLLNFRLLNSYMKTAEKDFGSIAGRGYGTFEKVFSNTVMVNTYSAANETRVGGIIGIAHGGIVNVTECTFDGNITVVGNYIGGLVGKVNNTVNMKYCHFTGSLNSSREAGSAYIGGMVAGVPNNKTLNMRNCLYDGSISITDENGTKISIIVGGIDNKGVVELHDVYATTAEFKVGTDLSSTKTQLIFGPYTGTITVPTEVWTGDVAARHAVGLFDEDSKDSSVGTNFWETVTDGYPILKRFKKFYKK